MGLELRTIHFLPGGRLEISGTANTTNEFTAVRRYALIAGWVGSGTMACPPPEGDWMTSVSRLHATREDATWGTALQGRSGPAACGSWF